MTAFIDHPSSITQTYYRNCTISKLKKWFLTSIFLEQRKEEIQNSLGSPREEDTLITQRRLRSLIRSSLPMRNGERVGHSVIVEQFNTEQLKASLGKLQKEIGKRKKESKGSDPCEDLLEQKAALDQEIADSLIISEEAKNTVNNLLSKVGNIVEDDVPVHHDEAHNLVIRTWGECKKMEITNKPGFCNHHKVLSQIGGYDPKRGQKVAGHRK